MIFQSSLHSLPSRKWLSLYWQQCYYIFILLLAAAAETEPRALTSRVMSHSRNVCCYNCAYFLIQLFNDSVSIETILSDNGTFNEYGAIGAMRIDRWNQTTWRKPAPLQLCSPQIPYDLTRDKTQAIMMGSQQLLAWAMVWLYIFYRCCYCLFHSIAMKRILYDSELFTWKIHLKLHFETCLLVS
jgi:hypothetical protein